MTDFASINLWDDADATSTNPICLEDILEDDFNESVQERTERKKRTEKKKRRRRRKKVSEEDESVADTILSELLSEGDDENEKVEANENAMPTVNEKVPPKNQIEKTKSGKQRRRERIEQLKAQKLASKNPVQPMRTSLYPSSDEESNNYSSKNPFGDRLETAETPVSDDDLSKNPFSDRNKTTIDDDDLSKNPFSEANAKTKSTNPFDDDTVQDRAISDSEESSTIRPPPQSTYLAEQGKSTKNTNPFANDVETVQDDESVGSKEQIETVLQEPEEDDSDEDIIESSKRLLRCVDQRIQYQQQNDEVNVLKTEVKQLKLQAEAMAEQLRRAVETKCDLVLAQNEMERNHEQQQIAKDGELRDLRLYIQEILEQQAISEANFMNEISSLVSTLESDKKKHANELEAKDSKNFRLETKIESMKVASVRGTSPESFRTRFTNASGKSLFVFPSYE